MSINIGVADKITHYFQRYFKGGAVDTEVRLINLGFESIDYIELASFLLKTTHKWLDISKIDNHTKISDINNCLSHVHFDSVNNETVILDKFQQFCFSSELKNKHPDIDAFVLHYLYLKESINIPRLEHAIKETLNNHFILNSKLTRTLDGYSFEHTSKQPDLYFKGSIFFPKRDISKLRITVHCDRLVNIYLQRKRNQYYLIIAFHHIAMDGWSNKIVLEEIFRRYAGLYKKRQNNRLAEIQALNRTYTASINESSNTEELNKIFNSINPKSYFELDHLFYEPVQSNSSSIVITVQQIKQYAAANSINGFSVIVIIICLLYDLLAKVAGVDKLALYTSLSNRYLPIPGISELITNLVTGYPIFLDQAQYKPHQFATKISETLNTYFKHMSYGAITRALMERNTILNQYISPYHQPYYLMLTYINDPSRINYGSNSIINNYICWPKSKTYIDIFGKTVIFYIEQLNDSLIINIFSSATKGVHTRLLHQLQTIFPSI